jgi:hypothetical protein
MKKQHDYPMDGKSRAETPQFRVSYLVGFMTTDLLHSVA